MNLPIIYSFLQKFFFYLNPIPLHVLGPSKPQPSDSPPISEAKTYLCSIDPYPTLHPFRSPNESIDRLLNMGYSIYDRLNTGTQSAPGSPRKGEDDISHRFPHLLSTFDCGDDFQALRKFPNAKDRLGVFIPSFSFPLLDEKRLSFNPYDWPAEYPSNEEHINRQFHKFLSSAFGISASFDHQSISRINQDHVPLPSHLDRSSNHDKSCVPPSKESSFSVSQTSVDNFLNLKGRFDLSQSVSRSNSSCTLKKGFLNPKSVTPSLNRSISSLNPSHSIINDSSSPIQACHVAS